MPYSQYKNKGLKVTSQRPVMITFIILPVLSLCFIQSAEKPQLLSEDTYSHSDLFLITLQHKGLKMGLEPRLTL